MSTRESYKALPRHVKSMVVAAALVLPSAAALSESMDTVKVQPDQIINHPGRDSVHAPVGSIVATPVKDPQQYGRAGGYVGADRAPVLMLAGTSQPSDSIKTGQSESTNIAQVHTYDSASAQ